MHAFLCHQTAPDDDFDVIVASLKAQAGYWSLASAWPDPDLQTLPRHPSCTSTTVSPSPRITPKNRHPLTPDQYVKLLDRAKRKWQSATTVPISTSPDTDDHPNLPDAIHVLLDLRRTAYGAVNGGGEATPYVSPPETHLGHLPAWAVQPLLGDLHDWFDLPAGLFQSEI